MGRLTQLLSGLSPFAGSKKSIEITVETNETWNVHWFQQSRSELCPICGAETIFIPADLGAQLVGADIRFIDELIEGGQVHVNTGGKEDLLCLSSLKYSLKKKSRCERLDLESENRKHGNG